MSNSMEGSGILERFYHREDESLGETSTHAADNLSEAVRTPSRQFPPRSVPLPNGISPPFNAHRHLANNITSSPLTQSTRVDSASPPTSRRPMRDGPPPNAPSRVLNMDDEEEGTEVFTDERARDVITGRLIHGHIVEDDAPSPALSAMSGNNYMADGLVSPAIEERDPMQLSFMSTASRFVPEHNALGGSIDPTEHSDDGEEEFKDPEFEHTVTLVGNVKDRIVFIIDDLIDQSGSWIAAAETVVKRGDAKMVYCIATHGLFGDASLEAMEDCDCISYIVVTNSCPLAPERVRACKKLVILDISNLLAEAIRRNHYGEGISTLFQHFPD